MIGNRHVRFGGRPRGTGPATAGTSPRGRPNCLAGTVPPPVEGLRVPARLIAYAIYLTMAMLLVRRLARPAH